MKYSISLFLFFCFPAAVFCQASDFITLKKKNNRTVKSFFPGTPISMQTVYGNYVQGIVKAVAHDSVFITQYDVRAMLNMWGLRTIDTVGSYEIVTHYKDIRLIVFDEKQSFGFIKNGTVFIIGGVGYAALNLINGKYLKEPIGSKKNKKSLAIALGVAGAGVILKLLSRRANKFERKYKIEYINMRTPQIRAT